MSGAGADMPRFVNHVDDHFLQCVTALYRQRIPNDGAVLDMMSSHVSHLPKDNKYTKVVGHGMNAQEVNALLDVLLHVIAEHAANLLYIVGCFKLISHKPHHACGLAFRLCFQCPTSCHAQATAT